ncbi:Ig heavy chain V region PJ14, partial [Lemmus lemmus]
VLSQVQQKKSRPGLVQSSQTLSLTCTVSGFSLTSYALSWVSQPPGKSLEWLSCISGCNGDEKLYVHFVKDRLSISRDNAKSTLYLQMSSLN